MHSVVDEDYSRMEYDVVLIGNFLRFGGACCFYLQNNPRSMKYPFLDEPENCNFQHGESLNRDVLNKDWETGNKMN
jgi:hypothetical protein